MNARRNEGFTLLELIIVVAVIGILAAIAVPNFISMSDHAKEAAVLNNAHTVQLSAEDYAVRNGGVYPSATGAAGIDGHALADLLPRGQLLTNPFTNLQSEPVDGAASAQGQVGYTSILRAGVPVGYTITGYGTDGVALTLSTD